MSSYGFNNYVDPLYNDQLELAQVENTKAEYYQKLLVSNSKSSAAIHFEPLEEQMRKTALRSSLPKVTLKPSGSTNMIGLSEVMENGHNSLMTKLKSHTDLKDKFKTNSKLLKFEKKDSILSNTNLSKDT